MTATGTAPYFFFWISITEYSLSTHAKDNHEGCCPNGSTSIEVVGKQQQQEQEQHQQLQISTEAMEDQQLYYK